MVRLAPLATLAMVLVLWGFFFAPQAQAAVAYNEQEIAFVKLPNDYRVAHGLQPLLVSDAISLACERHGSDMAKYKFFSHTSLQSDWFPTGSTPWDRMRLCGYNYSTAEGEIIAAGQATAQAVFDAWKGSATHNADMLGASYKVLGIGFVRVAGSPYTYYWVADFGGVVDPTSHTLGGGTSGTNRYEQADPLLTYLGPWAISSTSAASGGSFVYANTSGSSVTVTFAGTYLAWIAKKSSVYGKARVTVDSGTPVIVDLYSSSTLWAQRVWNTPTLSSGTHTVKIEWTGTRNASASGTNIGLDAFDVLGTFK